MQGETERAALPAAGTTSDAVDWPSRNDVRRQLILDEGNSVAQNELAFFQALNLDDVGARYGLQRFDRSVKIAMLLPQPLELCLQLDFFFFGHSQPPNPNVALSLPSRSPTPSLPAYWEGLGRGRRWEGREAASWPLRAHPRKIPPAKYDD